MPRPGSQASEPRRRADMIVEGRWVESISCMATEDRRRPFEWLPLEWGGFAAVGCSFSGIWSKMVAEPWWLYLIGIGIGDGELLEVKRRPDSSSVRPPLGLDDRLKSVSSVSLERSRKTEACNNLTYLEELGQSDSDSETGKQQVHRLVLAQVS